MTKPTNKAQNPHTRLSEPHVRQLSGRVCQRPRGSCVLGAWRPFYLSTCLFLALSIPVFKQQLQHGPCINFFQAYMVYRTLVCAAYVSCGHFGSPQLLLTCLGGRPSLTEPSTQSLILNPTGYNLNDKPEAKQILGDSRQSWTTVHHDTIGFVVSSLGAPHLGAVGVLGSINPSIDSLPDFVAVLFPPTCA